MVECRESLFDMGFLLFKFIKEGNFHFETDLLQLQLLCIMYICIF